MEADGRHSPVGAWVPERVANGGKTRLSKAHDDTGAADRDDVEEVREVWDHQVAVDASVDIHCTKEEDNDAHKPEECDR